jgi:replicative DNA helicase
MKTLPISEEGEKGFLGSMLLDPIKIGKFTLDPNEFYNPHHKALWKVLQKLQRDNTVIDSMLLLDYLKTNKKDQSVGGYDYLNELQDYAIIPSHSEHYATLVKEAYNKRQIISTLEKNIADLYNQKDSAENIMNTTISDLSIKDEIKHKSPSMEDLGNKFIQDCIDGKTGSFDWWCNEWTMKLGKMDSELMLLHAPRSTGKTALMLQWIYGAHTQGKRVPLASIEMLKKELLPRFIANVGQVGTFNMRTRGFATEDEITKSRAAVEKIKIADLVIRDKGMSINDIRGWAITESRNGVDAIFIDNLLSINDGGKQYQSKTIMYDYFIRKLRDLRDELQIPIIVLAHPNENMQIAWSRDVENFADTILFLIEVPYEGMEVNGKMIQQKYYNGSHVVAKFQKNRQGISPVAHLSFDKSRQTFTHMEWEEGC